MSIRRREEHQETRNSLDSLTAEATAARSTSNGVDELDTVSSSYSFANERSESGLTVLNDGRRLYVERRGHAGGPAILFMHGLGSRLEVWGATIDLLDVDETHDIFSYDFNGSGRSPLSGDLTIDSLAEDAIAVLDTFSAQRAVLVGHSMSGLVALTVAARFPDRIEKVITVGSIKSLPAEARKNMAIRAEIARTKGAVALATTVANNAVSQKTLSTNRLAYNFVKTLVAATPNEGYARAAEAIVSARDPDFGAIKAPVLLIVGAQDKTAPPSMAREIAAAIGTNARVEVQQDVGHWNPVEDPAAVASAVRAFL